ncbi:MAG TPA: WhiB family transcriptional regulator [Candidatus Avipropionibacterium avicola]|uniref:Transcriptional regulator WhiB n=1 Tax=Candidatus Avipropionibacterium avicola TaxID=2840701 RepID=A0A9D1GY24_9ACTN|nr:WhiB family transcriptional regulator [Candidatus Avipropionibacterium avicola]
MSALDVDHWSTLAKCRDTEDILFCEGAEQKRARTFCEDCPVRAECLADALDNRIEWGIWGGMTERERRALLRRNPEVANWWGLLCGDDPLDMGVVAEAAAPVQRTALESVRLVPVSSAPT